MEDELNKLSLAKNTPDGNGKNKLPNTVERYQGVVVRLKYEV